MHKFGTFGLIITAIALAVCSCDRPVKAPPPTAELPIQPWVAAGADPATSATDPTVVFAHCASCHMSDGLGRDDGSVPKLAGQLPEVLVHKLHKLKSGAVTLPVMLPFARALAPTAITSIAQYLYQLDPITSTTPVATETDYQSYCSSCHGPGGNGNPALLAPRLCGQSQAYLQRRLKEISTNLRGDADPAMRAIVNSLDPRMIDEITQQVGTICRQN